MYITLKTEAVLWPLHTNNVQRSGSEDDRSVLGVYFAQVQPDSSPSFCSTATGGQAPITDLTGAVSALQSDGQAPVLLLKSEVHRQKRSVHHEHSSTTKTGPDHVKTPVGKHSRSMIYDMMSVR